MIAEMTVTAQSTDGGRKFLLSPPWIMTGGKDANKVDSLHFALPSDWDGMTVTAVFTHGLPKNAVERVLDANKTIVLDAGTMAYTNQKLGLMATDGTTTAYSTAATVVCYDHPPGVGETDKPAPSAWEQFVAQVAADRIAAEAARVETEKSAEASTLSEQNAEISAKSALDAADKAAGAYDAAKKSETAAAESARAAAESALNAPDAYFVFRQMQASDAWMIRHTLKKHPAVTVVDSAGSMVLGDVDYLDDLTLQIRFSAPFSGAAYLN